MTKQTQVRSTEEAPARSALKLALEALTHFEKAGLATLKTVDAITAIREALAEHPAQTDWEAVAADQAMTIALLRAEQPAPVAEPRKPQQEPIAWMDAEGDIYRKEPPTNWCPPHVPLYTSPPAQPQQEPVAWRTFDGEGGYDYRTYDENEKYAEEWARRNPRHVGWVEPLYTSPPTLSLAQRQARSADTWVGLTDEEIDQGLLRSDYAFKTAEAWRAGVVFAMTKLKEKNT